MGKGAMLDIGGQDFEMMQGSVFPGEFALKARKHMFEFGTTSEQRAKVSVKNHKNGCLNPYSQFQKEVTVEEVLNSPMVADPLTVLMCCPNSDGSAAAVIANRDVAKKYCQKPIRIAASALRSGTHQVKRNLAIFDIDFATSKIAYEMSGYGPEDIDVVEVHDAFTIAEIMHYEGLGFYKDVQGNLYDSCRLYMRQVQAASGNVFLKNYRLYGSRYDGIYHISRAEAAGYPMYTASFLRCVFPVEHDGKTYFAASAASPDYPGGIYPDVAELFANQFGGHVVTINDADENNFLQSYCPE